MDLFGEDTATIDPPKRARIEWIGQDSAYFNTSRASELIGQEISVLHLLPVQGQYKELLTHDHAIVQLDDMEQPMILMDVKLTFLETEGGE